MTLQELQNQVLQLSVGDRWHLVQSLLGSIKQETLSLNSSDSSGNEISGLNPWRQSLIGLIQPSPENQTTPYDLTLELSDQVFAAIMQQAQAVGVSPERLATTLLEKEFSQAFKLFKSEAEKGAARARFEAHFGTLESSDLMSLDNESIEADLARE
ncbi:MAG: hypothetical protein WA865_15555 [Spirulinaceae cyanobacterium]